MKAFLYKPMNAFLRYEDFPGSEPTYVYLGGAAGASTTTFPRVVRNTSLAKYRAIMPDWLGCGFSDHLETFGYTMNDHADTIAQLLDDLHITACNLVAHSMGGAVAITLATQRPDLVKCLILAEGNLDAGGGNFSRSIAEATEDEFVNHRYSKLIQDWRSDSQSGNLGLAVLVGYLQTTDPRALHRGCVNLVQGSEPSWRDQLYQLTIPRAYVFGEYSLPDPDFEVLPIHGIRVATISQAGHSMIYENPDGFAEVVSALTNE
jgi:pimeloyl-ACP methyl ester carboxylesterase